MLFDSRAGSRELAQLCRRLTTAMASGIDVRKVWSREADGRCSAAMQKRLRIISDEVARGGSVSDGLAETGEYFPPLFREMSHVGERTGKLAEVYRQLADHYDQQIKLRRMFLAAITWPMLQLTAAVAVIGLLIWILGLLPPMPDGEPIDILGLGLIGNSGLAVYLLVVATVIGAFFLIVRAAQRGLMWTRPLQRAIMATPFLGNCLQTMALARMAWSMHVTMETGMDLRHSLALSLGSTHNARYTDHTESIVRQVVRGREIHEVLHETGVFPRDFLDTLEVGERSGRLPESMEHLSHQYQDQASRALTTLTVLAGFAVWGAVAILIIAMIFRLFFFYLNTITSLT